MTLRRFACVAAAALVTASACSCSDTGGETADGGFTDPGVDDGGAGASFATPCASNEECVSGTCLPSGVCSKACETDADCPAFQPWSCGEVGGQARCTCTVASATDGCNLVDDDCNGFADDGNACSDRLLQCTDGECLCPAERQCGDSCVDLLSDPAHCGECDNECAPGSACVEGDCACNGEVCAGQCVDLQVERTHCGACGVVCNEQEDCVGGSCVPTDHEWANWPVFGFQLLSSDGDEVHDQGTGLIWQRTAELLDLTWTEAHEYCAARNGGGGGDASDAGTDDPDAGEDEAPDAGEQTTTGERLWRVPTRIELLSIVDYSKHDPAFNVQEFSEDYAGDAYWTATPSATDPTRAWSVVFDTGRVDTSAKIAEKRVRCVK